MNNHTDDDRELAASTRQAQEEAPPYGIAAGVFAVIFALYVATIAPTTQFWDTAEYVAAASVLGIPHPPGNPLFVLMANVWGMIPLASDYALRINLFAALTSALASAFLFLCAEQFLRSIIPQPRVIRLATAFAGILVGATAFTVWNQSVVNEKVYTLSLFSIALCLWLGLRWADRTTGNSRDKLLLLLIYLLALTSTNHGMGLLVGPAIFMVGGWQLAKDKAQLGEWTKLLTFGVMAGFLVIMSTFLRKGLEDSAWYYVLGAALVVAPAAWAWQQGERKFAIAALAVFIAGLSLNGFLPIRAEHFPGINEGEPTNWASLTAVLTREQYQKGPLFPRQADIVWQYANYLQYFGWQFAHDWGTRARGLFAALFGAIGIMGAVRHWQRDRQGAIGMTTLMLAVTVILVFYLDFKFGYSIRPGENLLREVRERDYFFIASFQLWGVWTALGFGALIEMTAGSLRGRFDDAKRWFVVSPILVIAFIPLIGNAGSAPRSGEFLPRDIAWDILQSVEPYGVLITAGDNDTFPLWYMQEVEGVRQDVLLVNLSLANTQWHPRQIKRRAVFPFDQENAIDLYAGREWPMPTGDGMTLTYQQIDELPLMFRVPQDRNVLRLGEHIRGQVTQGYLSRSDLIVLQVIRDNLGKRPIFFSRTVGAYADQTLGMTPYLVGHGLVRKLVDELMVGSDSIAAVPALGWVDLDRTRALMFDTYHVDTMTRDRPFGWIDKPSAGIITMYAILYAQMSDYMTAMLSDDLEAQAQAIQARGWAETMGRQSGLIR